MTAQAKIIRAEEMQQQPHTTFVLSGQDTDGAFEWVSEPMQYGEGPVYHIHHRADELVLVMSGELKLKLDGELYDLQPGDTVFIPRGTPHTMTNVHHDQPAHIVGLYAPAGLQQFLELWEEAAGDQPMPDQAAIAELTARFGQEACGPPLAVELGLQQTATA